MNFLQIKTIHVISNGSLFIISNNFIKFKIFKLTKKDLLSNNKTNYKEGKKYLFRYKNKYLKEWST